jgi:putative spermidine/putrescine transport system permease protein/spermidine/putrescine transport system permease protein
MSQSDVNSEILEKAGTRERLSTALLFLPGLLIVLVAIGPALWLAGLSLISEGAFSTVHYQRIWDNASYAAIIFTTLQLSAVVTAVVVLIGYPATYAITLLSPRLTLIALSCVAIPFWTSLLVRTYAWMVILQRRGVINEILLDIGLIERPLRMANSFFGTTIGMVHIMLPFFIFPLYAAMRAIDGNLVRAAYSLGATPSRAFRDVFLPLSRHGVLAGALLTFVLCLGFYVTPQLLGGGNVTTISMKIQQNVIVYSDWGAASALGVVLVFVVTLILAGIRLLGGRAGA